MVCSKVLINAYSSILECTRQSKCLHFRVHQTLFAYFTVKPLKCHGVLDQRNLLVQQLIPADNRENYDLSVEIPHVTSGFPSESSCSAESISTWSKIIKMCFRHSHVVVNFSPPQLIAGMTKLLTKWTQTQNVQSDISIECQGHRGHDDVME